MDVINECSSVQKKQRVRRVEDQETWGQHGSGIYPKRSSGSRLEECHGARIGFDRQRGKKIGVLRRVLKSNKI
jgi:hypothetical protein